MSIYNLTPMQTTLIITEEELVDLLQLIKYNDSLQSIYWQLRSVDMKREDDGVEVDECI
ncbi:MAG: hypothetical protein JWQ06_1878 [Mucilaginibacter sp.]|nr:hypothetical protein [Mucilaginibacter sp.]